MKADKRERLEKAGWTVGSTGDFLQLTDDEAAVVELKLNLAKWLRTRRVSRNWTQGEMARRMGSSQSRMARVEAGDPSVSLDLMFRVAFAAGASPKDLARVVATPRVRRR